MKFDKDITKIKRVTFFLRHSVLVINCNFRPISHRFRDMASYWFKIAKFSYPLSFRALDWGDPYGYPETRVFGAADGEDLMIL